jgi:hypothetical protein
MGVPQGSFLYPPETLGNEFSVLTYVSNLLEFRLSRSSLPGPHSDFLETLDERSFFTPPTTVAPSLMSSASFPAAITTPTNKLPAPALPAAPFVTEDPPPVILPAATKRERFLLTAADQESGSRDERLNRVIRSKYEAGLLKPYNYVKGYTRLSRWMDRK